MSEPGSPGPREGAPDLRALGGRDDAAPGLIRMDLNTGPSEPTGLRSRLAAEIAGVALERYGHESALPLRRGLAAGNAREVAEVFVANGSMAVLQAILAAFGGRGRSALTFVPGYMGLQRLCAAMSTQLELTPRRPADFGLDPAAVAAALAERSPELVFFCHPGNPTGRPEDPEVVRLACRAAPRALVVVDEAYVEFSESASMDELDRRPANLVVVRSLSKAWGLAGARVGYALAEPEVVAGLAATQLPGAVSALTQAAAIAALGEDAEEHAARIAHVRRERERLGAALAAIDGVEVWPSSANFVLFRTPAPTASLLAGCEREGVLIRDVSEYPGLERCARATIATPEASEHLLAAVAAVSAPSEQRAK